MKLEKFDYQIGNKKKKNTFLILGLVCLGLFITIVLYRTFANFKVTDTYNIIGGKVATFTSASETLKFYLVSEDGSEMSTNILPLEDEYVYDSIRSSCENGTEIVYDKETNSINNIENDSCNIYFNYIPLAKQTLYALGYTDADIKSGIPYGPNGTNEPGFYAAEDDYGISYYYYGADPEWGTSPWFVIDPGYSYYLLRINGNGSVRVFSLDYQGSSSFNNTNNDNIYLGYMFGNSGNKLENVTNSTLKNWVETLYDYREDSVMSLLDDVIFCNDRSLYKEEYGAKEVDDTATGIGTDTTYYGAYYRLKYNKPTLKCINKEDAFTANDVINGNGLLKHPVGFLTADEVYMTGQYWPYDYWGTTGNVTMTPAMFKDGVAYTYKFQTELFTADVATNNVESYEVINLKYGLTYLGDGFSEPYSVVQ